MDLGELTTILRTGRRPSFAHISIVIIKEFHYTFQKYQAVISECFLRKYSKPFIKLLGLLIAQGLIRTIKENLKRPDYGG
jgi:hypothetical protein